MTRHYFIGLSKMKPWLSTTEKSLISPRPLYLVRGWGLGTRLKLREIRYNGSCNQCLLKIDTAHLAQPRNCLIVTRPLSSWESGSGHVTIKIGLTFPASCQSTDIYISGSVAMVKFCETKMMKCFCDYWLRSTLQKQSCYFSKIFGYYSCVTILTMQILWMYSLKQYSSSGSWYLSKLY